MANATKARKARFRAALALAGLTAEQWAARNDVTPGHLSQVLNGLRESRSLVEKIEAFAEQYIGAAA